MGKGKYLTKVSGKTSKPGFNSVVKSELPSLRKCTLNFQYNLARWSTCTVSIVCIVKTPAKLGSERYKCGSMKLPMDPGTF